ASYDSFKDTRNRVFTEHQFSSSSQRSMQWLNIYFSSSGETAYAKCLDAYVKTNKGIRLWAKDVSATGATVYVEWIPPAGLGSVSALVTAQGALQWQNKNLTLASNAAPNFAVRRDPNKELRIQVNVPQGYADDLTIPPDPKIPAPPVGPQVDP